MNRPISFALGGSLILASSAHAQVPDCNSNQLADSVELSTGRALDDNANLVIDECDYPTPLPRIRSIVVTRGVGTPSQICAAWDTNDTPTEHLWNLWVSRNGPTGPYVNRKDTAIGSPFVLQMQLRPGDNTLTLRYEPNGCGSSFQTVNLWLADEAGPSISAIVSDPGEPFSGTIPGLNQNQVVSAAGSVVRQVGNWNVRLTSFTWTMGDDRVRDVTFGSSGSPDIVATVKLTVTGTCSADLFADQVVNGADLGILLSQWGDATPTTISDINRDGVVNGADLGILLSQWGPCP